MAREQAVQVAPDGRTIKRWYVYDGDGRKRPTWEETPDAAMAKARRYRFAAVRAEPAPALLDEVNDRDLRQLYQR